VLSRRRRWGGEFAAGEERVHPKAARLDRLTATLLAIDHRQCLDDLHARSGERVDRCEQRATGGDDVVDDQHTLAGVQLRPLDERAGAVILGLLAHDERAQRLLATAQRRHPRGDGIGAERQPADGLDVELAATRQHEQGHQVQAATLERHQLAVEVHVAAPAAAEHEIAEHKGAIREEIVQLGSGGAEVGVHVRQSAPTPAGRRSAAGAPVRAATRSIAAPASGRPPPRRRAPPACCGARPG
jgi:hypothetical protein